MITKSKIFSYTPPASVRLCAASACQLSCPACEPQTRLNKKGVLGWGYLRSADFAKFISLNPGIKHIELSHSGEIFVNPELGEIIKEAFAKKVYLTAWTGVNLNKVGETMCEDLVKYQFQGMKVAIDGTDQETYSIYRRGGNFDEVIENVKTINRYKKQYKSQFPQLVWQFIPFSHNEHQILKAKKMAAELGMEFRVKLNARADYAPVKNQELVRRMSGSNSATRKEYDEQYGTTFALSCHELWTSPQINWDGKMLGCCANLFLDVGNVFEEGLETIMKSRRYQEMKEAVMGKLSPDGKDIPCTHCYIYKEVPAESRIRSTLKSIANGRLPVKTR